MTTIKELKRRIELKKQLIYLTEEEIVELRKQIEKMEGPNDVGNLVAGIGKWPV